MDTILSEIENFDIYEASKEYTRKSPKKKSYIKRGYWDNWDADNSVCVASVPYDSLRVVSDSLHVIPQSTKIKKLINASIYSVDNEIILPIKKDNLEIVLKNRTFFISNQLIEIAKEIEYSAEILDYEFDWDYDNALPVSQELYFSGIDFLIKYSEFILKKLGLVIQSPEINAGRNGNVYLAWRTNNARLAISIEMNKTSEIIANYYGDLGNDREPIKGNVTVSKISEYLAYWMKYLV